MGLGAGSRAGCLWAARRSAPLTPCRGKYAQMWLKVRHLSAFSHGGQNVTSELAAGVDFQVRQRVDSNGRQAPVCRKAPTNSPEDPKKETGSACLSGRALKPRLLGGRGLHVGLAFS